MTKNQFIKSVFSILIISCGFVGCDYSPKPYPTGWHRKVDWKAEKYYTDTKVIQLCNAIESNKVDLMESIIKNGVSVDTIGNDGMTPLFWAFANDRFEAFNRLLELGADPEVPFQSDFGTRGVITTGSNVFHTTAKSEFPKFFMAILKNGGDPNATYTWTRGMTVQINLFDSIKEGPFTAWTERCEALIKAGPSKELLANGARDFIASGSRFDVALMLLKAGADYKTPSKFDKRFMMFNKHMPFMELVAAQEFASTRGEAYGSINCRNEYLELVAWLEAQGEDFKSVQRPLPIPIDRSKDAAKRQKAKEQREKMKKEADAVTRQWERDRHKWK